MKKFAKVLSLSLAFVLAVGVIPWGGAVREAEASWLLDLLGLGKSSSQVDYTPLKEYATPVTLSVGRHSNPGGSFARGDSDFSNGWTRVLKEEMGIFIDTKNSFAIPPADYDQQINLRAASSTLPDVFYISLNNWAMFSQLVEAGRLADLTEPLAKSVGGASKTYLDTVDTEEMLKYVTVDGKVYGWNSGMGGYNEPFLWIRQDWLDELGLNVPETLDDIKEVALAFMENQLGGQDPTIGITMNPHPDGYLGQWFGIKPVFYASDSFPDMWVADERTGELTYGAVLPETKQALATLADWYQSGVLDRSMMAMASGDETRDTYVNTQASGMIFNAAWDPWVSWEGYQTGSVKNNEGMEWVPVLAPVNADGDFPMRNDRVQTDAYVVSADCDNPEAFIKAMNYYSEVETFRTESANNQSAQEILKGVRANSDFRTCSPFPVLIGAFYDNPIRQYEAIVNYVETDEFAPDPALPASDYPVLMGAYDYIKSDGAMMDEWYADPSEENNERFRNAYVGYYAQYLANGLFTQDNFKSVYNAFTGNVPTMDEFWGICQDLRNTTFLQIITGELPVDAFDQFVADWYEAGGDVITEEVNAAAGN